MKLKLALLAAALTLGVTAAQAQDTGQTKLSSGGDSAAAPVDTKGLPSVPEMSIGNPDAKVMVIEYGSFTCPHCEEWHATEWKPFKKDFIDTGKVKFIFREVCFDKYGLWAGMMAHCGGEMRYFGIVDMLYDTQQQWAGTNDPNQVVANLRKIGKTAGLSDKDLDQCMNDGKMAQALVAKFQKDTAADKIEGTPSFVIDSKTYTNMAYDKLKGLVDAELAKQG